MPQPDTQTIAVTARSRSRFARLKVRRPGTSPSRLSRGTQPGTVARQPLSPAAYTPALAIELLSGTAENSRPANAPWARAVRGARTWRLDGHLPVAQRVKWRPTPSERNRSAVVRWSVGIQAEADRTLSREEVVELADAVAAYDGIATGVGSSRYGAQLVVQADSREEAIKKATSQFTKAVEQARLPDGPIVRTEAVSEYEDENLAG